MHALRSYQHDGLLEVQQLASFAVMDVPVVGVSFDDENIRMCCVMNRIEVPRCVDTVMKGLFKYHAGGLSAHTSLHQACMLPGSR